MMVPQPTAQYGQVERVSLARAIFSVRSCAKAGCKSKPKTAAAAPPTVVSFRKSRRMGVILGAPLPHKQRTAAGRVFPNYFNYKFHGVNQILFFIPSRNPHQYFI